MNTFRHFLRLMGTDRWRARHYAAALWFALSFFPLAGADCLPWWGCMLAVANFLAAARWATTIPVPEEEEE